MSRTEVQHRVGDRHGDQYGDRHDPRRRVPVGVAVTPDGSKVYVANDASNNVSVIATATNTVTATIPVGIWPVAFGVFIQLPVLQSAPASGSLCNGIYDGTFPGNITVSAGQDCAFLNGGRITGNVTVVGGNFVLNGSSVGGNLTVNGGGTFTLGPAATVGGNLTIQNIPSGSASNSVCGTTVYGNILLKNDGTAVQIGSTAPLICAGNDRRQYRGRRQFQFGADVRQFSRRQYVGTRQHRPRRCRRQHRAWQFTVPKQLGSDGQRQHGRRPHNIAM